MKIAEHNRANFETLLKAFENGDIALLDVEDKATGESKAAIVAIGKDGEDFTFTPLAIMIEGNPFELFNPPNSEEEGYYQP